MFNWRNPFSNSVPKPSEDEVASSRIVVPIFSQDVVLGVISGKQLGELSDEEVKTLWFVLDKYLDTDTLGELYCEMKNRGLHVLLPSELSAREEDVTLSIMKFNGIGTPSKQKWTPDNATYEHKL